MTDHYNDIEKRGRPRVNWNFIARFRLKDRAGAQWATSVIKDISELGCLFHSDTPYQVGDALELKIQFPAIREPACFTAAVQRCDAEIDRRNVYAVGVRFVDVEEKKKKAFLETLAYFLKKQQ